MICPHCGKEADGYFGIQTFEGGATSTGFYPDVVTSNRIENEVFNPTYTLNSAGAANPPTAIGLGSGVLNVAGCANQNNLNIHYHTL